ncbi:MAG: permease-like cell division protein FtsX [Raineya sp.]|jgi:cell division transport system permease protein|nr:permease-like cell division protein FtsX [Raineya sp.]
MAVAIQQKSRNLGSYPYASVILSITIALMALGVLCMLIIAILNFSKAVKENVEVQVMLDNGLTNDEITKIRLAIEEKKYIRQQLSGKPDVIFKHKDEAAKELMKSLQEDFVALLGENPLRHSFLIHIKSDFYSVENLAKIKKELETTAGIFEVVYAQEFSDQVNTNVATISFVLSGFALFMMIIVIILIHNTIKLALFSQRFIIRTMQLVGATANFIRKPFIKTAFFQGLLSSIIAFTLLYTLIPYLNIGTIQVEKLYTPLQLMLVGVVLVVLGILLSVFSSFRTVNRYLDMNLDDLY